MLNTDTILAEQSRAEQSRAEQSRAEQKLTASFLRAKQNISEMVDHRI